MSYKYCAHWLQNLFQPKLLTESHRYYKSPWNVKLITILSLNDLLQANTSRTLLTITTMVDGAGPWRNLSTVG